MFEFLEHTGDLAVRGCGRSFGEALREVARAMLKAQLDELEKVGGEVVERAFEVEEETREDLVVSFLEEILFIEEVEKLQGFDVGVEVEGLKAKGVLKAYRQAPSALIKAITYHGLKIEEGEGVCITVVFDI